MAKIVPARVFQKVDTYNNWMSNNLILGQGEIALVIGNGGIPLNMRWGDGTKAFRDLPNAIAYDQGQFVPVVGNALPAVTEVGYTILGGGTYTQTAGGNVVVPDGKLGVLVSSGGTWSLQSEVELPIQEGVDVIDPDGNALPKESAVAAFIEPIDRLLEFGPYDSSSKTQVRSSAGKTVVFDKALISGVFNYVNIYNALDGTVNVCVFSKNEAGLLVLDRQFSITTSPSTISYKIGVTVKKGEYIGLYFKDYGFVHENGDYKDFMLPTLAKIGAVSVGEVFSGINMGDKPKVSFSFLLPTSQVEAQTTALDQGLIEVNSKIFGKGINHYVENTQQELRTAHPRTVIFNKALKKGTIKYIRIRKALQGAILVCQFERGVDGQFAVRSRVRVETNESQQYYKISLNMEEGRYLGVYFANYGYVVSTNTQEDLLPTLVYTGDPTAVSSFVASDVGDRPRINFGYEFTIEDNLDRVNSVVAVNKEVASGGATLKNKTKIGQPLYLPDPYGYNQFLHPNVLYFETPLFGYKYWMTVTPMPMDGELYADRYENPCIYVSNDGISWFVRQGGVNPIDELTSQNISNRDYMSDPCLVYREDLNRLECWYRITYYQENNKTLILRKYTTNGFEWSERELMVDTTEYHMIRSQAIKWDNVNNKYRMWYTGGESGVIVSYNESSDGKTWDEYTSCTGVDSCWHLDVTESEGTYYLINYRLNASVGLNDLVLYKSTDGINWTDSKVILRPEAGTWYSQSLYKSTLVFNGEYWIMYFSGWSDRRYVGVASGKDPYNLSVDSSKFEVGVTTFQGLIRLVNTKVSETMIEVSSKGHKIGFDVDQEVLYVQKPDGSRKPLLDLS